MSFGKPMPSAWWTWKIARETGWTLEYIRSMSIGDLHDYFQIMDGERKARTSWKR